MIAVKAIYEDGKVRLLEPFPSQGRRHLIVTILDEQTQDATGYRFDVFEPFIGATAARADGAEKHDAYICDKGKS